MYDRECSVAIVLLGVSDMADFQKHGCVVVRGLRDLPCIGALALALKNWRHYIYGTRCTITRASELYKLELSGIHNTFHVLNLKKCLSDENLVILLDEIRFDNKLHFIEEPIEILDREVEKLKQSRIPIVKVRWNY
ncbi:hypothetical protein Tco_0739934 [Tanacetum coccineum]